MHRRPWTPKKYMVIAKSQTNMLFWSISVKLIASPFITSWTFRDYFSLIFRNWYPLCTCSVCCYGNVLVSLYIIFTGPLIYTNTKNAWLNSVHILYAWSNSKYLFKLGLAKHSSNVSRYQPSWFSSWFRFDITWIYINDIWKMSTELLGGLLESAINSKSLQYLPKLYYKRL